MSSLTIYCEALTKFYTDASTTIDVLKGVDLHVNAGEMVAINGASGSGKSTLLHILAGLDKPSGGRVLIKDQDIHSLSEAAKCSLRNQELGFIYQFHHLLPEFSALENTCMPLLIRGCDFKAAKEKATYLLEKVGLQDRLSHSVPKLSGGERQRVAIARALVAEPSCVLADEPTGNLDPDNAEKVLDLFFDLQRSSQTSVIMVTHDPLIAARAQRSLCLENGVLIDS